MRKNKSTQVLLRPAGLIILFILCIVFFPSCKSQIKVADSLLLTQKLFSDPPAEFRPTPFWVWNDQMTVEKIKEQLIDFKEKGFGGVFVHPRPGLITPYLSEEWLALFKEAVKTGKALGLKVWIYDENSYPSGFAGGLVPAARPEAARSGLKATQLKLPEISEKKTIICVLQEVATGFVDITERVKAGEKGWPEGNYWIFEVVKETPSPWYGGFTYVDLMRPGVTQAFLRLTHDAYKRVCGDEFGQAVPGCFQDEAEIAPAGGAWAVNFTPALFAEFSRRRGYELPTVLPSLLVEKGDFRRARHDFYLTCLELFIENWAKPYYEYCSQNNLQLTGHYWEHEWPSPRVVPDSFALNAYAHLPGIDVLMNNWQTGPHAQFGNSRAVRELRSVANQLGRKRTLAETYGASGWDLTFFDQKRIGDWEYALGVNFLNQHLIYATIVGARKRDHPPSFSYHEPWWSVYRLMNDYFGRLSAALSSGEQLNRILVVEPTTSAWMYYSPAEKSEKFEKIGQDFQNFVHRLEQLQIEYDLGSEFILKDHGRVNGKKFQVGQRAYDLVILPSGTENLEPWTAALLRSFLKGGGRVLSWAESQLFQGGRVSSLGEEFQSFPNFKNLYGQPVEVETISRVLNPDIEFKNLSGKEMLFHQRRQFQDGQLLFLANISPDHVASGQVRLRGKSAAKWEAFSGQIEPYPAKRKNGRLSLDFSLKPGESLLVAIYNNKKSVINRKPEKKFNRKENTKPEKIIRATAPLTIKRLDPNVLTLDYCDLTCGGRTESNLYFYQAQRKAYIFHGLDRNPWDSAVQYQDSLISKNKFSQSTGFKADFHFEVAPGVDLKSLKLVVERPEIFKVQVNGQALPPPQPDSDSWWLDKAFGVFPLEKVARPGVNTVTLVVRPFDLMAELEPIYILGDFAVQPASKGFLITAPAQLKLGSWKTQGLPFYGQRMQYSVSVEIKEGELSQADFLVQAGRWKGAIAEVEVNGEKAGHLLSPYDFLVITDKLKPGKNDLSLTVYGTLKNTLGPHHLHPAAGMAWPGSFQKAPPDGQPAGSEYDFLDYGLFDDLIIKKIGSENSERAGGQRFPAAAVEAARPGRELIKSGGIARPQIDLLPYDERYISSWFINIRSQISRVMED